MPPKHCRTATVILLGLALMAVFTLSPNPAHAQRRAIRSSEVEVYFPDSLRAGTLRRVSADATNLVSADVCTVRLRPDEYLVTRTAGGVRTTAPFSESASEGLSLPYRVLATDVNAEATLFLRPAVEIEGGGLRYRGEAVGFQGSLLLGVVDSLDTARSHELGRAIPFAVTAEADRVAPDTLGIDHTNLPFERVQVTAIAPPESVRVHIRPEFDPEGVDVWMPVQRPAVQLDPSPARIQGFGLETATLSIGLSADAPRETRVVRLTSTHGDPDPNELVLDQSGVGLARIRSSGLGQATLRAASPPFHEGMAVITYAFPLAFLLAALFGGAVGGLAAALWARRQKKPADFVIFALSGLAVGLISAVAYAVGINVLDLQIKAEYGEALVFSIAALAAMFGIPTVAPKGAPAAGGGQGGSTAG